MSRERGTYGPPDPDSFAGWGTKRIGAYASEYAKALAVSPFLPAIDLATRASRSVDRLSVGTRLLRSDIGKPRAVIGQELFHTVADRSRALAMLSTGFQALSSDLAVWQTANIDAPTASATAQWLAADVTPTLDEFKTFVAHESKSWWVRLATSWDTYETWWERLKQLRALARAHGITLQSAEPVDLPKTIWQTSEAGKGSEATALLGVLKIGTAAVLTVMGLIGVVAVVRELRPKPVVTLPTSVDHDKTR
jgi:hypothetical protein